MTISDGDLFKIIEEAKNSKSRTLKLIKYRGHL